MGTGTVAAAFGDHEVVATLTAASVAPSAATVPVTVEDDAYGWLSPTIPLPRDFQLTAPGLVMTAGLASAFLLLAAIPAELLQSTLTENYSRAFGWLTPVRRRRKRRLPRTLRRPWLTCGLTVAFATLILGFGQTGIHLQAESAITFASLFMSLTVLNLGLNAGRIFAARRYLRTPGRLMPMPGALVVGLLPFTYLDGKAIHDWKRRVWAVSYVIAAEAFILIVAPTGESWTESHTPLLTWLLTWPASARSPSPRGRCSGWCRSM